jgi:hypothetical protein
MGSLSLHVPSVSMKSFLQTQPADPRIVLAVRVLASARSMLFGQVTQSVARGPLHVKQLFSAGQIVHFGGRN